MDNICSSEESRFHRANGAFGYLQHSFFSGLLRKKFHGGNGVKKAQYVTFWCYTDNSLQQQQILVTQESSLCKNEGSKQPEVTDSADKRPRRSRALQKLEVNRVSNQALYLLFFAFFTAQIINLFIC